MGFCVRRRLEDILFSAMAAAAAAPAATTLPPPDSSVWGWIAWNSRNQGARIPYR